MPSYKKTDMQVSENWVILNDATKTPPKKLIIEKFFDRVKKDESGSFECMSLVDESGVQWLMSAYGRQISRLLSQWAVERENGELDISPLIGKPIEFIRLGTGWTPTPADETPKAEKIEE